MGGQETAQHAACLSRPTHRKFPTANPSRCAGRGRLERLAGQIPAWRFIVPRRQQRRVGPFVGKRFPGQGQADLHRPAV